LSLCQKQLKCSIQFSILFRSSCLPTISQKKKALTSIAHAIWRNLSLLNKKNRPLLGGSLSRITSIADLHLGQSHLDSTVLASYRSDRDLHVLPSHPALS